MNKPADAALCPCGGGRFPDCCGRFIGQQAVPQTALELMRSRYTAYTLHDDAYLYATWHRSTRPAAGGITTDDAGMRWMGLEVRSHQAAGDQATVEFVARYKVAGRAHRLHEISHFVREQAEDDQQVRRWFYVDGSFPEQSAAR